MVLVGQETISPRRIDEIVELDNPLVARLVGPFSGNRAVRVFCGELETGDFVLVEYFRSLRSSVAEEKVIVFSTVHVQRVVPGAVIDLDRVSARSRREIGRAHV